MKIISFQFSILPTWYPAAVLLFNDQTCPRAVGLKITVV